MNSWKVILATMVIFATGVITGGLLVKNTSGDKIVVAPRNPNRLTNQPPLNVTPVQLTRMDFLLRARNELGLTSEQHDRIEKIIREGQDKSRKIWDDVAPEMRKELQLVQNRIRAELSPDQRRKFEQILRSAPRQPGPDVNPQALPGPRDRQRQNNGDLPPFNPNAPQRPRRENLPPLNNPQPPQQPPQDNPPVQ